MSRRICEITAQNKQEALMALDMLKEEIQKIPYSQSMKSIHEKVLVINEGRV